jgi:proliferating cell nuclear antigen
MKDRLNIKVKGGLLLFKVKMADAKILKDMMSAISILVDEATFDLTPDGIKLRAMDPSRVAMVDFEWPKTVFDEYTCSETMKMCINISEMLKLLRRTGKDESIELSLDEKTGRLKIAIKGKYTRTFNMPTLEAMEEEVPTPKVTFNIRAKTTTEGLREAIEDASLVSDHVRMEADNEKIVMNATGDIMGATIEFKKGSDVLLDIEAKEASKATFSLSYLSEIVKAAVATSEIVTLEFSTDMPIKLDFQQGKEGKLTFYLAPRIEVE